MLKYDGVDPQAGAQYSRYDRVRVESVFKEALKKEKDLRESHPRSTTFQMNLINGNMKGELLKLKHSHNPNMIITEKVQKRSPLERNTENPHKTAADLFGDTIIRHVEKAPWQKVDLPQSRAQEIGWLIAASITTEQINAQRSHSMRANPVGHARVEAYRNSQSLSDLSGGKVGAETAEQALKSRSAASLPCLIPHLPNGGRPGNMEGMRPEARSLNQNKRRSKNTCPETVYADKYYAVMRHSPFNQKAARDGQPPEKDSR